MVTDYATAELVKAAANSFLATKISFINAMAEVCEASGADVTQLADAIGYDARIGRRFLNAGLGFGGGCLPKDIRAFMARAGELGADQALAFLREIDSINMRRRVRMVDLAREVLRRIDRRPPDRRARSGVQAEQRRHPGFPGAERRGADAAAGRVGGGHRPEGGGQRAAQVAGSALRRHRRRGRRGGADLVLLLTEWDQYRQFDPVRSARSSDNGGSLTAGTRWTRRLAGRGLDLPGAGAALETDFDRRPHPQALTRARGPRWPVRDDC